MKHFLPTGPTFCLVLLMVLTLLLFLPASVEAGGLGLTGNFYRQHYELSPGETSTGSDVYVMVTNPDQSPLRARIHTEAPPGVTLLLSDEDFTLEPGGQRKVTINVQVSSKAVPGDYGLTISAEAFREGTGIKVTTGVEQEAKLSILGESGKVVVSTLTQDGTPFSAAIGIYQEGDGDVTAVRPLETGRLECRLVPGDYIAQAHVRGIEVAEESFSLATGEEKTITLMCDTLVVSEFSAIPVYSEGNNLASVKISYAIDNLDQPVNDVRAVLKVDVDDQPLDETEIISFSTLDPGSMRGGYSYIPAQGWQEDHTYEFAMGLYAGDELRYETPRIKPNEEQSPSTNPPDAANGGTAAEPTATPGSNAAGDRSGANGPMIGGIIGGAVVVLAAGLFFRLRRRER